MMDSPPIKRQKIDNCEIKMNKEIVKNNNRSNGVASNGIEIDENLYSRQLYVMGTEAMKSMSQANVLISGMGGLGVEISKNIILAGVKSVMLNDTENVTEWDLASNYYLKNVDIGYNRALTCVKHLAELNSYVDVKVSTDTLSNELLSQFNVVVVTNHNYNDIIRISTFCHHNNIKLVVARSIGLCGMIFVGMGPEHVVLDANGEEPLSVLVQTIHNDKDGLVVCLEETRHGFQNGDYVTFSEVGGMTPLNNCLPRQITVDGPMSFKIGDLSDMPAHTSGGICTQVKMPIIESYKSFKDALISPNYVVSDFAKYDRSPQMHALFSALDKFMLLNSRFPCGSTDFDEFVVHLKEFEATLSIVTDDDLTKNFVATFKGNIAPICAVIGGISAQEVLKACSGKFSPIKQFFYFDAFECLESNITLMEKQKNLLKDSNMETNQANAIEIEDSTMVENNSIDLPMPNFVSNGSISTVINRYRGQVEIFGESFQERLANCRVFIVGAGAIGCELLKNMAMMGIGTNSDNGRVFVTDMDLIERSNLNRQFLFRNSDIHQLKSTTAAKAVKQMNPYLNIEALQLKVGRETESYFNDDFFGNIDVIVNALDNVEARQYVDRRCVFYERPLLESGTLGTKGNVQVVIPHITESYSSSQDPPEKSIPVCTLKNFPYMIEHTIQWARDLFEGLFSQPSISSNQFLNHREQFLESINKSQTTENIDQVVSALCHVPTSFSDCIMWAKKIWQEQFCNNIKQLLHNFPSDSLNSQKLPFWSGTKRCPKPLEFNSKNMMHFEFVLSAAKIRAFLYNIDSNVDAYSLRLFIDQGDLPKFAAKEDVKIPTTESEANKMSENSFDSKKLETLIVKLESLNYDSIKINLVEFEKDDDNNFHMNFITAASNLRAENYNIETADRLRTKLIAGKIIPAIATTTSLVAGLVSLELYKIIQGHKKLELFKNGFINLALPFFGFSEPIAPVPKMCGEKSFTLWDKYELKHPMTLQEFIDYFKNEHNLIVTMVTQDVSMVYAFFQTEKVRQQRLKMTLTNLVETVSKKPIEAHVKSLVFEISCTDFNGEDIDTPYIKYNL